jgi:hypothetical protein
MNIQISTLATTLAKFIRSFHLALFGLVMAGILATLTISLYSVVHTASTPSDDYKPSSSSADFDQSTIKQLEQLHTSTEYSPPIELPTGRTNPFSE